MRLLCLVLACLGFTACRPAVLAVAAVGDESPATWVYITSEDSALSGVYRCTDARSIKDDSDGPESRPSVPGPRGKVTCVRAEVREPK